MTSEPIIRADKLHKRFGSRVALEAISLSVAGGEIVGLLGPNGAGKTTTLSILATALLPDSGTAQICAHDLANARAVARRSLGLVPQSIAVYPALTAIENLQFFAEMQLMNSLDARAAALRALEDVGLADRAADIVESFSGGMKRRLNLACGMIHRPKALLLDEPTVGVDPQSRQRIFASIEAAAQNGAAVLYSTNYMEEAEQLCDRVILIDGGKIVAEGTAQELVVRVGARPQLEILTRQRLPLGWIASLAGVTELARPQNGVGRVAIAISGPEQVPAVLERAAKTGGEVLEFNLRRPNLQDAFLALTGHRLRDPE